jgi:hypothetical protein
MTPPAPGGGLFSDDFETGTMTRWTVVKGLVAQKTTVRSGAWAAGVANQASGFLKYTVKTLSSAQAEVSYRVAFRIASRSTPVTLLAFKSPTNGGIYRLYLTAGGKLAYQNPVSGIVRTSSTVVSSAVWHTLRVHVKTGAAGRSDVVYDGSAIAALSRAEGLPPVSVGRIQLGDTVGTHVFAAAFDDVVVTAGP